MGSSTQERKARLSLQEWAQSLVTSKGEKSKGARRSQNTQGLRQLRGLIWPEEGDGEKQTCSMGKMDVTMSQRSAK